MDLVLNRRGGVPIRDQLRYQLELWILTGRLLPGQRLPSVRALASRLQVHPNTVASSYKDLEATGHVEVRKGTGVFVRPGAPAPGAGTSLDDILRLAIRQAFRGGHCAAEIRAGVERWLASAPVERVVVVDAARPMADLLAEEVRLGLGVATSSCSLDEVETTPSLLSGVLALALPYHLEAIARLSAAAVIEPLTLEIPDEARREVLSLPPGALLLLVSHAPTVLPFAEVLARSLIGDGRVETRLLADYEHWRPLVPLADFVVADVFSAPSVRSARPRRFRELRLVATRSLDTLRGIAAGLTARRAASTAVAPLTGAAHTS
jgi:DNA-binding transcriptional regulator YhcF (GntR family)